MPNLVFDINIDGVQIFKNSTQAQAYPILGRIAAIGALKLSVARSPPFIIGIYHGPGAPCLEPFLHDLMREIDRLDPLNGDGRGTFTASLRAVIADAPMRVWLKGIVSYSGYHCCERCTIR